MSYTSDNEMSSTDDSSLSRPLSGDSGFQDGDEASWDMLNSTHNLKEEEDNGVDQSFATIREEAQYEKEPTETPTATSNETPTTTEPKQGAYVSDVMKLTGLLVGGYAAFYLLSTLITFCYWSGRIYLMKGTADDLPANPMYFDLHNTVCSRTLETATKKLHSCIAVAEQFENKLYFKACYKEYEKVIEQHHTFCNWNKKSIVNNTFLPEFSRLLEIGGEGLTGMVEFLNEHHINFEGMQNVGYQIIDGSVNALQYSGEGLHQFSDYLSNIGFNKENVKKTSFYVIENSIRGSQFVIEAGANALQQSVQLVQDIDTEDIKNYIGDKFAALGRLI